jgi:hypothetical protein
MLLRSVSGLQPYYNMSEDGTLLIDLCSCLSVDYGTKQPNGGEGEPDVSEEYIASIFRTE